MKRGVAITDIGQSLNTFWGAKLFRDLRRSESFESGALSHERVVGVQPLKKPEMLRVYGIANL